MIEIKKPLTDHFADMLADGLNSYAHVNNVQRTFKIITNGGEAEDVSFDPYEARDAKERAGVVFGVFDADPSRLAPMRGITVITYTGTLDLMVEAKHGRTEQSGEFEEVTLMEQLLNGYAQSENGTVFEYKDKDGKAFTVTANFSPAVTGEWQVHSTLFGEVVPVSVSVYLTAVENGISANDMRIWVDGYPVYYESLVLTRQKTPDQHTFEQSGSIKTSILQHAFGLDFTTPLLRSRLSRAISRESLMGGFNTPHVVTVELPGEKDSDSESIKKDYLCTFGTSSLTSQPGKNVGATVSLVELKEELALATLIKDKQALTVGDLFKALKGVAVQSNAIKAKQLFEQGTKPDDKSYAFIAVLKVNDVAKAIRFGSFVFDCAEEKIIIAEDYYNTADVWVSYGEL